MSTVKIKRSGTTTSTPSSLDHGELAINYADSTLFWKDATNTIKSFVFQAYASATHTHVMASISDVSIASPGSPAVPYDVALTYNYSTSSWVAKAIGNVGIGSQPLGGWPPASLGASLAGKVDTSDARLTDARTPTAHKSTHATGGSDALAPSDIGAAPAASPTFTGTVTVPGLTSTGVILADDAATANSVVYSFDGDPNTGIGRAGADVLTVVTNGSERVRVTSGGTLAVTTNLEIHGGATAFPTADTSAFIGRTDATGSAPFDQAGSLVYRPRVSSTAGRSSHIFYTGSPSVERLRINETGAAIFSGVITVSATSGSAGSYAPSLTISGDANTGFGQVSGQSDTASVFTAGHERVRVDSSGRVGIGTATLSPWNQLVNGEHLVVGSGAAGLATALTLYTGTNGSGALAFADGTNTTDQYRGAINYSHTLDAMRLWTASTVRVNIDSSGNVGIGTGTSTPASRLEVSGVITVAATSGSAGSYAPSLTISGDPNTGFGQVSGQSDSASVFTAGHERVRVKSTGAVRFVPLAADPGTADAGDVYYNSSTNKLRVYDGTSWVDLH